MTSVLMLRQGRHGWIKIAQLLSASLKILVQFKFICQENKKTDFFFEWLFSLLAPEASQCQEQQCPRLRTEVPFGSRGCPKFFPNTTKWWWLKLHVPLDSSETQEANSVLLPQLLSRSGTSPHKKKSHGSAVVRRYSLRQELEFQFHLHFGGKWLSHPLCCT